MQNFQNAMNYETLILALKKSDGSLMPVFNDLSQIVDMSESIVSNLRVVCKVLDVKEELVSNAFYIVRKEFEKLPQCVKIIDKTSPLWPKDATEVEFLYLIGNENLLTKKSISIVGTRNPSNRGMELAREAVRTLDKDFVIVSGLALGIDGASHIQALADEKETIGVIGTPINKVYPKEHQRLQSLIAEKGLLVSQFGPSREVQKYFFMMRNHLMSEISSASLIVESKDGGGGVKQAKYSESAGKPVFIFREVFENRTYLWPRSFENAVIINSAAEIPDKINRKTVKKDEQLSLF